MAKLDDNQNATASGLVEQIRNTPPGPGALWNLAGAVGAGKTSLLRLIRQLLKTDLVPLMVAAPADEVDCAPIALLEMAGQLKAADLMNGEMPTLNDPCRTWDDKLAAVTRVVAANLDKVVILCDEPIHWYHQRESLLDDTPNYNARKLAEWISEQTNCRRVISGWIPGNVSVVDRMFAPRLDDGRAFIAEHVIWREAAGLATLLLDQLSEVVPERSPWEMKLCVALSRYKPASEVAAQAVSDSSATVLLREILDFIEQHAVHNPMRAALARLAISRTAIDEETFDELTRDILPLDRDLIRVCLCESDQEQLALHPLVRHEVIARATDPHRRETNLQWRLPLSDRVEVHKQLRNLYVSRNGSALRNELESLHHELLGGNGTVAKTDSRLRFVEQLHEIGRTLSYFHRDHKRAVGLFRLALQFNTNHPYSHHYLAFNLDWLAEQSSEVEEHYKKAISLQPTHPWWWSRWISYLATRGRFREARSTWRNAVDALSISEDSPPWIFLSLHRWVARWLLHWGELEFAEEVLRSIRPDIAETNNSIQALWDLLRALRVAEEGPAVFPLTVPERNWWSPNPHTDLPNNWQGQRLQSWKPAHVEAVDDHVGKLFLIAAAQPPTKSTPLEFEEVELTRQEVEGAAHNFQWQELREGQFVELAYYGEIKPRRIGLHREVEWRDEQLIPLVPPPDRWYRHAINAAWTSIKELD